MKTSWRSSKPVRFVHTLGKILCVCTIKCEPITLRYLTYWLVYWTAILLINSWRFYKRQTDIDGLLVKDEFPFHIIEGLFTLSLNLMNFVSSLRLTFLKKTTLLQMYDEFERVERNIANIFKPHQINFKESKMVSIIAALTGFQIVTAIFLVYNYRKGPYSIFMILYHNLLTSVIVAKMFLDVTYALILLNFLNDHIYSKLSSCSVWLLISTTEEKRRITFQIIEMYQTILSNLYRINEIFGMSFGLLVFDIICFNLNSCSVTLKIILGHNLEVSSPIVSLIGCFCFGILSLGFGFLVTHVCSSVVDALDETVCVVHKVLSDLRFNCQAYEQNDIKSNLLLLVEQIYATDFRFTASGWFPFDLTALLMVIEYIVMYVVVIPKDA